MYEGIEPVAVKASWAHELSGFANNLHALAWALENLPERAPNVIAFRNLARQAPAQAAALLPLPKADPARIAAELAKLETVRAARHNAVDGRDWARRIMERHKGGGKIMPYSLDCAKKALRTAGERAGLVVEQ